MVEGRERITLDFAARQGSIEFIRGDIVIKWEFANGRIHAPEIVPFEGAVTDIGEAFRSTGRWIDMLRRGLSGLSTETVELKYEVEKKEEKIELTLGIEGEPFMWWEYERDTGKIVFHGSSEKEMGWGTFLATVHVLEGYYALIREG